MKPLLRVYIPMQGLESIEVFQAYKDAEGTMIFPVTVNGILYSFFLNDDAIWDVKAPCALEEGIIELIGLLIEKGN